MTLIELWQLGNDGDEQAIAEIDERGFNVQSFLHRPMEELI